MFIDKLEKIKEDLNKHNYSKSILFEECVNNRLNQNLQIYIKELSYSEEYLLKKKEVTVLQRLRGKKWIIL